MASHRSVGLGPASGACARPQRTLITVSASSAGPPGPRAPESFSRRALLAVPPALVVAAPALRAAAFTPPPPGLRFHQDKLDGYSFFYPEDWLPVTTSGNDVFFRNPFDAEENCFVDVSSPSSSRYDSVGDLGTPEAAAQAVLDQFFEEFMSTRLGVRREGEVVSAAARVADDGRTYLDIATRVRSYASRNQLAVSQVEIDEGIALEWDRRYLTVLGVANRRLYSLRLQTANRVYERDPERLLSVARSFRCREV